MKYVLLLLSLLLAPFNTVQAIEEPRTAEAVIDSTPGWFSFELPTHPERPRSTLFPPLASFFFPGFDQWWEGQYKPAAAYTGTALIGAVMATRTISDNGYPSNELANGLSSRDGQVRDLILGNQLYLAAGSFSAYHSFRSAVRTRKESGEYAFLTHEEGPDEILGSVFAFSEMKKPSTWIPLAGALALASIALSQDGSPFAHNAYNGGDAAYGATYSYLAGANEEALFRGYLMPLFMQSWKSEFWSNSATALLFGAAHIGSDNPLPWPQLVGGWYLGYLTQKNEWTLRQSVFIHTWWDVIAFTATYLHESRDPNYRNVVFFPTISF